MDKIQWMFFRGFIIFFLAVWMGGSTIYAQSTVTLIAYPDERTIYLDSRKPETIAIIAQTKEEKPQFAWNLYGPGELDGDRQNSGIFYIPPDEIDGESARVIITVVVINNEGNLSSDNVEFTLLAPAAITTPTPVPATDSPIIQIRRLKEKDGPQIYPTYFVEPGSIITIDVDIKVSPNNDQKVEYKSVFGTVKVSQQKIVYTAPDKPGSGDIITIRVIDKDKKIITQEIINITVREKSK